MAFPTLVGTPSNTKTISNATSHTLTYPSGVTSGELLIAIGAIDGVPTVSGWPSGWVEIADSNSGANSIFIAYKFADGTESGNFTVTSSASEQGSFYVFRIQNANVSTPPAISSSSVGTNTVPSVANINPADWGTEDTLWIAALSIDASRTVSSYPPDLTDNRNSSASGGTGGATAAFASVGSAVETYIAGGSFTISVSDDWISYTIAVRPASAGKSPPPYRNPRMHRFYTARF